MEEEAKLVKEILELVSKIPFGALNFTVNRHGGHTVNITLNEFENKIFTSNEEFAGWLMSGLKSMADQKYSGSVSFTITLKEGQFKKVTEHRYIQKPISEGGEKNDKST